MKPRIWLNFPRKCILAGTGCTIELAAREIDASFVEAQKRLCLRRSASGTARPAPFTNVYIEVLLNWIPFVGPRVVSPALVRQEIQADSRCYCLCCGYVGNAFALSEGSGISTALAAASILSGFAAQNGPSARLGRGYRKSSAEDGDAQNAPSFGRLRPSFL